MAIIQGPAVEVLGEIRTAFGVSYGDIGQLCTFNGINPMAKYKPCRYDKKVALTDAERAAVNFGTNVPEVDADGNIPVAGNAWTHLAPRGFSHSEGFRVLDFNGYQHARSACVGFADNGSNIGDFNSIDWSTATSAYFMVSTYYNILNMEENTVHLKDVLNKANVHNAFGVDASNLYVWCAIVKGTAVYAKRTTKTVAEIANTSGEYDIIEFKIRGNNPDFNGDLGSITGSYSAQWFVGGSAAQDPFGYSGQYSRAIYEIPYRLSLNCFGGNDVQDFILYDWNEGLSITPYAAPLPLFKYGTSGNFNVLRFSSLNIADYSRAQISGTYVANFACKIQIAFGGGGTGAYMKYNGLTYPAGTPVTLGTKAVSVSAGGQLAIELDYPVEFYVLPGQSGGGNIGISSAASISATNWGNPSVNPGFSFPTD